MADRLDRRIRQLMGELNAAAPVPHDWDDVRSGSFAESDHVDRRSRLLLVAAAVVAVGTLVAGIAVTLRGQDRIRTNDESPFEPVDGTTDIGADSTTTTTSTTSTSTSTTQTSSTTPTSSTASTNPTTTAPTSTTAPTTANGAVAQSVIDSLRTIATGTGSSVLVAQTPDGQVVALRDGTVTSVDGPADAFVHSDGTFVFWTLAQSDSEGITWRSTAATLDGNRVCEVDGRIHRLRQRDDGTFVASTERDDLAGDVGAAAEIPVPNFAIDCDTLDSTPIEPISWLASDSQSRAVTTVNGRTFTAYGDAEGNARVVNEQAMSVNGDDYAGSHVYSADGSQVAYGDYGVSSNGSPLTTETMRSRDTTTGELLWSVELDRPFAGMYFVGDVFVAELPPTEVAPEPYMATEYLAVYDAPTGEFLRRVDTELRIIYLG